MVPHPQMPAVCFAAESATALFARGRRSSVRACASGAREVPVLELRNVTYTVPMNYSKKVFSGLDFSIYRGQFILLIGENGAGKSTALNLMSGFVKPDGGRGKNRAQILWNGERIRSGNLINKVGLVLQNPGDYLILPTVLEELIHGRPSKGPDDVRRIMAAMGMSNVSLLASPRSLSGGQVRRLAIASQLMRDPLPELFLLDEPLAGVDWAARRDLTTLLGSLKSQFAVVIVSHEPGELLQYADRVVEVRSGSIHDVDTSIVKRAIVVYRERRAAVRAKAFQDAAEDIANEERKGQTG